MYKGIELLAPAGGYDSVVAAVNGGCNAIYIGGKNFNARAYADNPDDEQLKEIIDLCHLRCINVFITVNTLYKENEMAQVLKFVDKMYEYGADGFIIQDLGLFYLLKKHFPDVELHASTQMTVHNYIGAAELEKMGFDRVVLSRELSLKEIKEVTSAIKADVECFVHGALCVSYSGRCLMSSLIGGRSGNRGRCAQPCRMEYSLVNDNGIVKKGYLLSPKDISTVGIMRQLIDAGIYSFKVEGRMKSPEYVYQVISTYRSAIDNGFVKKEDIKNLTQIFNRGGSSETGYYNSWAGINMMSSSPKCSGLYVGEVIKSSNKGIRIKLAEDLHCGDGIEIWNRGENTGCGISQEYKAGQVISLNVKGDMGGKVYKSFDKQLNDSLKKSYRTITRQRSVAARIYINVGKPAVLELMTEEACVRIQGEIVLKAENQPITVELVKSRLSKTGNTPFIMDFKEAFVDKDAYVPVSALNNLRRSACEKLEEKIKDFYRRKAVSYSYEKPYIKKAANKGFTVLVQNEKQLKTALKYNVSRIYAELSENNVECILKCIDAAHSKNTELYVALPRICRSPLLGEYGDIISRLDTSDIDGYLVRSYGSIETEKNIVYDYSFNAFNSSSVQFLKRMGQVCLSPELNVGELKEIAGQDTEIVVYGRLPLMTTHQCPIGLYDAKKNGRFCSRKNNHGQYYIKDRKKAEFPVMTHCDSCTAFILNSAPVFVLNKWNEIDFIPAQYRRLEFTIETENEMDNILNGYVNGSYDFKIKGDFTGGHFFRGVL